MKYQKYLQRVCEGESAESVLTDMIIDLHPPGPGQCKATIPKKNKAYQNSGTSFNSQMGTTDGPIRGNMM